MDETKRHMHALLTTTHEPTWFDFVTVEYSSVSSISLIRGKHYLFIMCVIIDPLLSLQ